MLNFHIRIFLTLAVILFSLTCCNRNTATPVSSTQKINRIISAAPSNTEIIIGLGLGDHLVAIDKYSEDITGIQAGLPKIDFFYPDTEAIIGLAPDLVIANEINSFGVADNPFKMLGDLGIRVLQVPTSAGIEGIYSDILLIAETLEVKEKGESLVQSMKDEIESIASPAGERRLSNRKSVYFEISSIPTMVSFGQGAYLDEMIEIAGGRNIFSDQRGWFSPSAEEIISRNPDIIFVLVYGGEDAAGEIINRRAFESITAVRENRVYGIDANSASRPSQNIMLALREMSRALNSE